MSGGCARALAFVLSTARVMCVRLTFAPVFTYTSSECVCVCVFVCGAAVVLKRGKEQEEGE